MSRYQVTWAQLIKSMQAGRMSSNTVGSLYMALEDANRVIIAAKGMAHAITQGDIAAVQEECGDGADRPSESWYEEADEWKNQMYDALEQIDRANTEGYPHR